MTNFRSHIEAFLLYSSVRAIIKTPFRGKRTLIYTLSGEWQGSGKACGVGNIRAGKCIHAYTYTWKYIYVYISYSNVHIHCPIYEYLSFIKYQSHWHYLSLYFFHNNYNHLSYHIFICLLFVCLPLEWSATEAETIVFYLLLYHYYPEYCLTHSRCPIYLLSKWIHTCINEYWLQYIEP